ncbi:MAG: hypothetical protein Athens041674_769 [Parcubacteria group bacterium Athens0416_74]|nr:MAG: hypothetical protein Athens041674_769 [Parcubacteria group bacterium Athens0416_74]
MRVSLLPFGSLRLAHASQYLFVELLDNAALGPTLLRIMIEARCRINLNYPILPWWLRDILLSGMECIRDIDGISTGGKIRVVEKKDFLALRENRAQVQM